MQLSVSEVIWRTLQKAGVDTVFGYPGSTNLGLLDTLSKVKGMRLILPRHEQGAAHMADGYTRASGKPSVCLVSRGPGACNLLAGMHTAYQESVPVIALVGQVDSDILYRDAFEEMDLVTLFRPVTKYAVEISWPSRVEELVKRAVHFATTGRTRPVMLSLPGDLQDKKVEWNENQDWSPMRAGAGLPPEADLEEAVALAAQAKRILILAGGGVRQGGAVPELIDLAEHLGAAVLTTWMRCDVFPTRHPQFVGMTGTGHRSSKATKNAVAEAEVVLAVGCRFSEFGTNRYKMSLDHAKLIHLDSDPAEIGKIYQPFLGLCGDAKLTLASLAARLRKRQSRAADASQWAEALHQTFAAETAFPTLPDDGRMYPEAIVAALREALSPDSIIVTDSGAFYYFITRYYEFSQPGTYYPPTGGCMGFGLPAALGVKLAKPRQKVICVCGDGGLAMTMQELETAVRHNIDVVCIVFNNSILGNIVSKQKTSHENRFVGSVFGNVDFAKVAQGLGAHGEVVCQPKQLAGAMQRALQAEKMSLIDVRVDPAMILP